MRKSLIFTKAASLLLSFLLTLGLAPGNMFILANAQAPAVDATTVTVSSQTELRRAFTHGAATGGATNWTGARIVIVAGDIHITGSDIILPTPAGGTNRREITLRADGAQRSLTTNLGGGGNHIRVDNRTHVILDDANLHIVGRRTADDIAQGRAGTRGGGIWVRDGGRLTLNAGTIRDINDAWHSAAVHVWQGGTFIMNGGIIRDNWSQNYAGGVMVDGSRAVFEMHGGEIINNTAEVRGGGATVSGSATMWMYGGRIANNRGSINNSGQGGGGGVRVDRAGVFNMQGGIIESNEVVTGVRFPYGGGVSIYGGTFNMNGGEIRYNIAPRGGGVAVWEGVFNMGTGSTTPGRVSHTAKSEGNPIIRNNHASGGRTAIEQHLAEWRTIGHAGGGGVFLYGYSNHIEPVTQNRNNFTMNSGEIINNTARFRGAGVFINAGMFRMNDGLIANNSTISDVSGLGQAIEPGDLRNMGGGVALHGFWAQDWPARFDMRGGTLQGNSARQGGAIARGNTSHTTNATLGEHYFNNRTTIQISGNSQLIGNYATLFGGAIRTENTTDGRNRLQVGEGVVFAQNRAADESLGLSVGEVAAITALPNPALDSWSGTGTPPRTTIHSRIFWSGENSVGGVRTDPESWSLFNNHDISNEIGNPVPIPEGPNPPPPPPPGCETCGPDCECEDCECEDGECLECETCGPGCECPECECEDGECTGEGEAECGCGCAKCEDNCECTNPGECEDEDCGDCGTGGGGTCEEGCGCAECEYECECTYPGECGDGNCEECGVGGGGGGTCPECGGDEEDGCEETCDCGGECGLPECECGGGTVVVPPPGCGGDCECEDCGCGEECDCTSGGECDCGGEIVVTPPPCPGCGPDECECGEDCDCDEDGGGAIIPPPPGECGCGCDICEEESCTCDEDGDCEDNIGTLPPASGNIVEIRVNDRRRTNIRLPEGTTATIDDSGQNIIVAIAPSDPARRPTVRLVTMPDGWAYATRWDAQTGHIYVTIFDRGSR